jgi:ankyrin repeat protein
MAEPHSVDGASGVSLETVVVTEEMITLTASFSDLARLRIWAAEGVRVTTAMPLVAAVRIGHLGVLRCLVRELGADINQATLHGHTPLLEAIYLADVAEMQCLVALGADVTSAMPLVAAVRNGHLGVLQCLVQELGADVNQATPRGLTPLTVAAERGNLAVVLCLAELGVGINLARPSDGRTPLLIAANVSNVAAMRCLVLAGARVGAVDNRGNTALLASARGGQYAKTQFLLEEGGANIDDVDEGGNTVWSIFTMDEELIEGGLREQETDSVTRTGLLQFMVLRGAPPPMLVDLLSPEDTVVVQEGDRLRARLPAYLVRRRALLDAHCPVLLPPLRDLVHGYMELTTTEELWATGLGTAP